MIRDEDGQLTGYVNIDLNTTDNGGFVDQTNDAGPKSGWGTIPSGVFQPKSVDCLASLCLQPR